MAENRRRERHPVIPELGVGGAIDPAHSTFAQLGLDLAPVGGWPEATAVGRRSSVALRN
jgi:hypothetical protein